MSTPVPIRADYPVMLNVTARQIVIVGGGAVAARKAAGLLEAGATRIRCVAPSFAPDMPPEVERVADTYAAHHLDGAGLAFAATDAPEVNDAVVRDARSRGVLVNRADAHADDGGDFVTPALFREGAVTVTVSAGSPALAVLIRKGIAERWDVRWTRMSEAMRTLRPMILQSQALSAGRRTQLFRELAAPEAMDVLADGGIGALTQWLRQRYPELA